MVELKDNIIVFTFDGKNVAIKYGDSTE